MVLDEERANREQQWFAARAVLLIWGVLEDSERFRRYQGKKACLLCSSRGGNNKVVSMHG